MLSSTEIIENGLDYPPKRKCLHTLSGSHVTVITRKLSDRHYHLLVRRGFRQCTKHIYFLKYKDALKEYDRVTN